MKGTETMRRLLTITLLCVALILPLLAECAVNDLPTEMQAGRIVLDSAKGNGASSGNAVDGILINKHNNDIQLDINLSRPLFMRNQGRGQNMVATRVLLQNGQYVTDGRLSSITLKPKVRTAVQFIAYCVDFEKANPTSDDKLVPDSLPSDLITVLNNIQAYETAHPRVDITGAAQAAVWLSKGKSIFDIRKKFDVTATEEAIARGFLPAIDQGMKNKADEKENKNLSGEIAKLKKEKQLLAAEIEKLKKEKEKATIDSSQKQILPATHQSTAPLSVANPLPSTPKNYTDETTGMEFVFVPGGCFQMGDTFGDGDADEKPVHEACVDGFYMGKYEVTQEEYQALTGVNPSESSKGSSYPVENVSWDDTQAFIKVLNSKSGKTFRLPTEAEWEYAARSGGKSEKFAGSNSADGVAWYKANSGTGTHQVGTNLANGFGLYDMSGNVWEWCTDRHGSYYESSPQQNPTGPVVGSNRVNRGGGWNYDQRSVRSANRAGNSPDNRFSNVGFRLLLQASAPGK